MRVAIPGFIGPAYQSRSKIIDCQECINLYPEIEQGTSKNVTALIGTPGRVAFTVNELGGRFRGIYPSSTGKLYTVFGNNVYEIGSDGIENHLGNLLTTSGQVRMCDNGPANVYGGDQLFIADGTYGYIVTMSTGAFTRVTSESFQGSLDVTFKDSYFVVIKPDTQEIWQSAIYNGLNWDGLAYATAEGTGDLLVRIVKTNNELLLVGKQSIEVWYNTGNATGLTFARAGNAFIDIGTDAPDSVAVNGNECLWLGSNNRGHGVVWHLQGYTPVRISTHAIEYAIGEMSRIDDAVGYCYQQEGHFFYVLSFPTGNTTFVYDLTTGLWHRRTSYKRSTGLQYRHASTGHAYCFGRHLVGDYYGDGYLYELDMSAYTDGAEPILRTRTAPHVHSKMKRLTFNEIEIDVEKGVGTIADSYSTEAIMSEDFSGYDDVQGWYESDDWSIATPFNWMDIVSHVVGSMRRNTASDTTIFSMDDYYQFSGNKENIIRYYSSLSLKSGETIENARVTVTGQLIPIEEEGAKVGIAIDTRKKESSYFESCYRCALIATYSGSAATVTAYIYRVVDNSATLLASKTLDGFDTEVFHTLLVVQVGNNIAFSIDGVGVCSYEDTSDDAITSAGEVWIDTDSQATASGSGYIAAISDIVIESDVLTCRAPVAMLQLSRDGGKVWGAEHWRGMGKTGEYYTDVRWNSCGTSRDMVARLMISDPIPVRIINAFADVEVENG